MGGASLPSRKYFTAMSDTIKVKVKATGKIINVVPVTPNMTLAFYRGDDGIAYTSDMLEPAEPDWQALHSQASISALQGFAADDSKSISDRQLAKWAVSAADKLIEELKRRYNNENSIPSPQERVV